MRPSSAALITLGVCMAAAVARGQTCGQWLSGVGPGGSGGGIAGADSTILSLATWDPDGPGPLPPLTVITGHFGIVGDQTGSPLTSSPVLTGMTWDGEHWARLFPAAPLSGASRFVALGEHGHKLICAISTPTSAQVFSFDGSAWTPLGSPIATTSSLCIASYGGELIVGGSFAQIGSVSAANIAGWNGSVWQALGDGLSGGSVSALAVHNGALFAGGSFLASGPTATPNVAVWSGSGWAPGGQGLTVPCSALASSGTQLAAISGPGFFLWNGQSWNRPLPITGEPFAGNIPRSIVAHQGSIFLCGDFGDVFPIDDTRTRVGRFASPGWELSDPQLNYPITSISMASRGDELISAPVGALLNLPMIPVRRWNGVEWGPAGAGFDGPVQLALKVSDGVFLAAGTFTGAGGRFTNGISLWNGSQWTPMDNGLPQVRTWSVRDAVMFQGQPVLAGSFTNVGGNASSSGLARWNGELWTAVGPTAIPFGSGLGLGVVNGQLVAATTADTGAQAMVTIQQFDGASWTTIPGQLAGFSNSPSAYPIRFAGLNGGLVVGGNFTSAGGVPAAGCAMWNGQSWTSMSAGLAGAPYAMAVHNGMPHASGYGWVQRWNGAAWESLPAGALIYGRFITSLISHAGELWAGTDNGLRRWDGSAWYQVGSGQSGTGISALVEDGPDLLAACPSFSILDGRVVGGVARWSAATAAPVLTPTFTSVSAPTIGSTWVPMEYTGTAPFTDYHLFQGGVERPLSTNTLTGSGFYAGQGFVIVNPVASDAGDYRLQVTDPCGSAVSAPVHVTIVCSADFDRNGVTDVGDLLAYLNAWFAGDPTTRFGSSVGGLGVLRFLQAWFNGC
jgi:hypothetical protein